MTGSMLKNQLIVLNLVSKRRERISIWHLSFLYEWYSWLTKQKFLMHFNKWRRNNNIIFQTLLSYWTWHWVPILVSITKTHTQKIETNTYTHTQKRHKHPGVMCLQMDKNTTTYKEHSWFTQVKPVWSILRLSTSLWARQEELDKLQRCNIKTQPAGNHIAQVTQFCQQWTEEKRNRKLTV